MKTYVVTDMAGREVAGRRSPGAGKTVDLTDEQAAHPLRLGHIELLPAVDPAPAKTKASSK